jgi:transcriptional regulator with AAA-type ATPase domain
MVRACTPKWRFACLREAASEKGVRKSSKSIKTMNQQHILQSPIIPPQMVPLIQKASQNSIPILILGERGIGKERVAKAIHQSGEWKYHRFHKIDCKMLKEKTFFSQLTCLFSEIRHGAIPATVFCKEVGALDHRDQLNLLELIEEGVFKFNGEKRMVKNLRWIASSSEDLNEKAKQGKFSEDLYGSLNALPIHLPPLRDRIKDIPSIVRYLLVEQATRMNLKTKGISQSVLSLLQSYWWPGNLKELEMVILRMAISSAGGNLMEKDLVFDAETENHSFSNFLGRRDFKDPFEKKDTSGDAGQSLPWIFFLAELVHRIKNPLVSINTFTKLLGKKFNDDEFRASFYKVVTDDIERIDLVLNGLLNYVKMSTPLNKSNTIHQILEEALKRHEAVFQKKSIKIFKKHEKGLPETMIHEEQLRYILDSLIQYVLPIVPPRGSIGFLTKLVQEPEELKREVVHPDKERQWIEILMIFTGFKKKVDKYETIFGILPTQPEESEELELRLIHEIVNKNKGRMVIEVNKEKPRTLISLRLPIERRRVIYYPTANI